jgi:hypothetical protein
MRVSPARWILILLAAGMLGAGCSQGEQGSSGMGNGAATTAQTTTAGSAGEPGGPGEETCGSGQAQKGETARKGVTLRIKGTEGSEFSGSCDVADQVRRIGGTVPQSYTFKPGREALECRIDKQGPGDLKVVFGADGSRSVQQVSGQRATIELRYENGSLSSSVSSSS